MKTVKVSQDKLGWKVHTHKLFEEILSDPYNTAMRIPLNILQNLLRQVAERAIELNDTKLNQLMMRLTLYSVSDPTQADYDPNFISKYLRLHFSRRFEAVTQEERKGDDIDE